MTLQNKTALSFDDSIMSYLYMINERVKSPGSIGGHNGAGSVCLITKS